MFRRILFVTTLLILSACSTLPNGPDTKVNLPAQLERLRTINSWQIQGRIAFRRQEEAVSANVNWKNNNDDFRFRLTNLLGITMVDMTATQHEARLKAQGETYHDSNPSELIYNVTGWDIPVTPLLSWIKGLPVEGDDYRLDDNNLVEEILPGCVQCEQWQVTFSNFGVIDGVWLPHGLTLRKHTDDNVFIKIRIDQWTISK